MHILQGPSAAARPSFIAASETKEGSERCGVPSAFLRAYLHRQGSRVVRGIFWLRFQDPGQCSQGFETRVSREIGGGRVRSVRACVRARLGLPPATGSLYFIPSALDTSTTALTALKSTFFMAFRWTRVAPCLAMISLLLGSSHALTCGGKPVPAEFGAQSTHGPSRLSMSLGHECSERRLLRLRARRRRRAAHGGLRSRAIYLR